MNENKEKEKEKQLNLKIQFNYLFFLVPFILFIMLFHIFLSFYSHFYNLWSQHAIKNIISFIFSMLTLEVMKEVLEKEGNKKKGTEKKIGQ